MDIDVVKKPGGKDYYPANKLKKKCKKRDFQGIHDRFIRDQDFRIRMIASHRDEDLCRRLDALADEDQTHRLTAQEYFHYKSKWCLHSNKQFSNTLPLRHRPDSKRALSTLQRLQQEAGEEPHVRTYSHKHKQLEAQGSTSSSWNWQGSWWTLDYSASQEGDAPRKSERADLLLAVLGKLLRKKTSTNSIYFVTD